MNVLKVLSIGVELNREREKYVKKHDAENYIKFLEDKNQLLLNEYTELYNVFEELKKKLETLESTTNDMFKKEHLILLAQAVKRKDEINTLFVDEKIRENSMYKVYFQELLDWNYFEHYTYYSNCIGYKICSDKLLIVKRLLAAKDML